MTEWVEAYGPTTALVVSIFSLIVAGLGLARSRRALKLAHPAFVKAQVVGAPRADETGRPARTIRIENTGPGPALNVRVKVGETFLGPDGRGERNRAPVRVTERLGIGDPVEVEIRASGDDDKLHLIKVQWSDGGGRHSTSPGPPKQSAYVL